jgi:hypothetical protein
MPTFAQQMLADAREGLPQALRALVRVWRHLEDHQHCQTGLNRSTQEQRAAEALRALRTEGAIPDVHPFAALRALDEHLADFEVGFRLGQRVHHVEEEGAVVVPRPPGWTSVLARGQPNHRVFWMRLHHVLPSLHKGIRVHVTAADHRLDDALGGDELRVWAGGFIDGAAMAWKERPPTLQGRELRAASLVDRLAEVAHARSQVVVFPELCLDPGAWDILLKWLASTSDHPVVLLAGGSCYEGRSNRARLVDADGQDVIPPHVKLEPMRAPVGDEDIDAGDELRLVATRKGLVGIAICLDFCEGGEAPVATLWSAVAPALLLVPSMGTESTNHAHQDKARGLQLLHASTVLVANQHPDAARAWGLLLRPGEKALVEDGCITGTMPWPSTTALKRPI